MEKYNVHIGNSLKKQIAKHNISVSELSEKIGLAREYIYQLYRKEDISTSIIKNIVNNTSINIADLLQIKLKTNSKKPSEAKPVETLVAPVEASGGFGNHELEALKRENELLRELIKTKDTLIHHLSK